MSKLTKEYRAEAGQWEVMEGTAHRGLFDTEEEADAEIAELGGMPRLVPGHYCYWVDPSQDPTVHGGYVPSIVVENVSGHYPMLGDGRPGAAPWVWGLVLVNAEKAAAYQNRKLGLTPERVDEITTSSLVASIRARRRPGNPR